MALFMIVGHDVAYSTELRKQTRDDHVARLKLLESEDRLLLAGPCPIEHGSNDMCGSLIVAEFEDLEAVQQWANEEPYLKAGVYSHVDVRPFIKTLPSH